MLQAGDTAPDFTFPDQDGNDVTLSGLRGSTVVLYFYPPRRHSRAAQPRPAASVTAVRTMSTPA